MTNPQPEPKYTTEQLVAFEAQLKSCPHCDGRDIGLYGPTETEDGGWDWMIVCDDETGCDGRCMRSDCFPTPEEAIAAWNNSEQQRFRQLQEDLQAKLKRCKSQNPSTWRTMPMNLDAPTLEFILKIFKQSYSTLFFQDNGQLVEKNTK